MKTRFWDSKVEEYLKRMGRQDLIDRGDALAERVTALLLTSHDRLDKYMKYGGLYNNKGGISSLNSVDPLYDLEEFVNVRLRQEINSLECLLSTFDDITPSSNGPIHSK